MNITWANNWNGVNYKYKPPEIIGGTAKIFVYGPANKDQPPFRPVFHSPAPYFQPVGGWEDVNGPVWGKKS